MTTKMSPLSFDQVMAPSNDDAGISLIQNIVTAYCVFQIKDKEKLEFSYS